MGDSGIELDIIWDGINSSLGAKSEDSSHYYQLQNIFLEKLNIKSTGEIIHREEIEACINEHELVSLLRTNFEWTSVPKKDIERFQKNGEMSSKLRERANSAYKNGSLKKAMRGYNLALSFAPVGSVEKGLAFANRSALLVTLKEYNAALKDIEYALQNNFPPDLRPKLEQRRSKCIKSMESTVIETDDNVEAYFDTTFFILKHPNPRIPTAEFWVDIDYRDDRGRRLITREPVPAGTLILIDKPFVSVINNLLFWDTQHCHACYKQLLGGVVCDHCTFTIYCDEICKRKSVQCGSHKYEHKYLSYLHTLTTTTPGIILYKELQSLRLLGLVGPDTLFHMFQNYQNTGTPFPTRGESSPQIAGFSTTGIYNCGSYEPVYHLISHGMQTNLTEKVNETFKALFLTRLLKEHSDFFIGQQDNEEFENFVASLLLRHLWNIKYNAISVNKLEKNTASGQEMSVAFATAVNPLISLCNHSCHPNTAPIKKFTMLETALVTLKDLQIGEEICITYKPLFAYMKRSERRNLLKENYNFLCTCLACVNGWSPKTFLGTDEIDKAFERKSHCPEKEGCAVEKPCEPCLRHHLQQFANIDDFESKLYQGDELIRRGDFANALQILKPCLSYFGKNFSPCYSLSQVALDLYKRALVRLANEAEHFRQIV